MSTDGLSQFGEALADRRAGLPYSSGPDTPFPEVKPEFYGDAYELSNAALERWWQLPYIYPPYGLVENGEAVERVRRPGQADGSRWQRLESVLSQTAWYAFDQATPTQDTCPYAPVLRRHVGIIPSTPLTPYDHDERGVDSLRARVVPGAQFAPALIVNLISRMHMLKQLHGAESAHWDLAQHSARSLLEEPLLHPQQWAKAFVFTLARGYGNNDVAMLRDTFLDEETAAKYTELRTDPRTGREVIGWALPTEEFMLRAAVKVADRTRGNEMEAGDHQQLYPMGTRLGDILVTEPRIKCPGFRLAYAMWDTAVDVAIQENLWTAST